MEIEQSYTPPQGYTDLCHFFNQLNQTFVLFPRERFLLDICQGKQALSLLLDVLLDLCGTGNGGLSGWHYYNWKGKDRWCLFVTQPVLTALTGASSSAYALQQLQKLKFVDFTGAKTNQLSGRRIYLRFDQILSACSNRLNQLMQECSESGMDAFIRISRAHRPKPVVLYLYQDLFSDRIGSAYATHATAFKALLRSFNTGQIDSSGFRSELAAMSVTQNEVECFEPLELDWVIPNRTSIVAHAAFRLTETTNVYASLERGVNKVLWQGGVMDNNRLTQLITEGDIDLLTLQMIGVALAHFPHLRKDLHIAHFMDAVNNVSRLLPACLSEWERVRLLSTYHPSRLVLNELLSLGWLEIQFKYKKSFGDDLLTKWLCTNATFSDISLVQRLCLFGKLFPDETGLIRKYATAQDRFKRVPNAVECISKMTEEDREIMRCMYPAVFAQIENEVVV